MYSTETAIDKAQDEVVDLYAQWLTLWIHSDDPEAKPLTRDDFTWRPDESYGRVGSPSIIGISYGYVMVFTADYGDEGGAYHSDRRTRST